MTAFACSVDLFLEVDADDENEARGKLDELLMTLPDAGGAGFSKVAWTHRAQEVIDA